jgi:hypothetical protein
LKKRTKKLLSAWCGVVGSAVGSQENLRQTATAIIYENRHGSPIRTKRIKVFWFFFSKKNSLKKRFFLKKEAKAIHPFRC